MQLEDDPRVQVQAMRSVNKTLPLDAITPAVPSEIFHVDTNIDPKTNKEFVLWEDILQAFKDAVQVRDKTRVVPFLKDSDFRILDPRRIAAIPNAVLDVVLDTPVTDGGLGFSKVRQTELLPSPPPPYDDKSNVTADVASQTDNTPTSSVTSAEGPHALSNDLDEAAKDNTSKINTDLASSSAEGPHALSNDQPSGNNNNNINNNNTPVPPHSGNGHTPLSREPQSVTINRLQEMKDLIKMLCRASQRNAEVQVALGNMYKEGKGVPQDYQAAMNWYFRAAEQDDPAGQYNIGYLHQLGLGVPQNYTEARNWYLKAAYQGNAAAQTKIGLFYACGFIVERNDVMAIFWYLKAANQGHADAQYYLGSIRDCPGSGSEVLAQAMDWYVMAANQGHADAQHSIGSMYDRGRGVRQDYAQAMTWYLKAAKQDHAKSHFAIGALYENGEGVPQNHYKAAEWYEKGASRGWPGCSHRLNYLREKGHIK